MMLRYRLILGAALGLVLAILVVNGLPGTGIAAQKVKKPELKCCYTNPQYSGTCEVTPSDGETCSTVLAYLNNPNAHGKTYCGGTDIRGGWKQVQCEEKK
jgi:hypothetical protein